MTDAIARLDRLEELAARGSELRADLRRSLALEELWPGLFKLGKVTAGLQGNPYSTMRLRVTAGEEVRTFKVREVPLVLVERELRREAKQGKGLQGGAWSRRMLAQHPELRA